VGSAHPTQIHYADIQHKLIKMLDPQTDVRSLRVAFLLPTVELGSYWKPILTELKQITQQVRLYTGRPWPGFDPDDRATDTVEVVGKAVRVNNSNEKHDYSGGYLMLSPKIIGRLLALKPQVVVTSSFSIWTMLVLLFKPIGRWRVIIIWDGSSPNVDFRNSKSRLWLRRTIAYFADRFVMNSEGGRQYFTEVLGVRRDRIVVRPYLVPDTETLLGRAASFAPVDLQRQAPTFLYVGRLEERKGLHLLLRSCNILHKQGCKFSLIIIGSGQQRSALEDYCHSQSLDDCVKWVGWVDYHQLGVYFHQADVFVFPSLEDIWGMVAPEAMAFGKPVICSKWAGAAELITHGLDGFICDPHDPTEMAMQMQHFIAEPQLIPTMGAAAKTTISHHTPQAVARFFAEFSQQMIDRR
jgi:glycosyltransferase involved in cell wall biosynthesis